MKTNVYIDGFNLYFRALKNTDWKWLNLAKVAQAIVPRHEINVIRYFTAVIEQRPGDPQQQRRQQTYLRALRTIPNLSIHYGQFKTRRKIRPLAEPIPNVPSLVTVIDTEEKGSDVNVATYLLVDGYENQYEQAIVISNDSDLALPIQIVRERLNLSIGVINPDRKTTAPKELRDAATFTRVIWPRTLRQCQFPETLTDSNGTITRPASW